MDLLACRWANPFLMLDEFIRLNQLHDFVNEVVKTIADEKKHEARWQYYLHAVCLTSSMSFEEYVRMCDKQTTEGSDEMTPDQIGKVISESKNILVNFQ